MLLLVSHHSAGRHILKMWLLGQCIYLNRLLGNGIPILTYMYLYLSYHKYCIAPIIKRW